MCWHRTFLEQQHLPICCKSTVCNIWVPHFLLGWWNKSWCRFLKKTRFQTSVTSKCLYLFVLVLVSSWNLSPLTVSQDSQVPAGRQGDPGEWMQFFSSRVCRLTVTAEPLELTLLGFWFHLPGPDMCWQPSVITFHTWVKEQSCSSATTGSTRLPLHCPHSYTLELGQWENNWLIIIRLLLFIHG